MTQDVLDGASALGAVVEADRGSLPFRLIHGEGLVTAAAWALDEAGVVPLDFTASWEAVAEAGEPFCLHDALCPMTPPGFLAACVALAREADVVVIGVRPVTDTVKVEDGGLVGETIDRDGLLAVASPIVLPAGVVCALEGLPSNDFVELAGLLAARFEVRTVEAPPAGRRVATEEEIRLLEVATAG
ncbi:MAG: 2-C-methyl-D-erythritol 4-phosphate cytidylyltransferase [Nocardioides sp.]|uniref:2-C-methyl-D-erythritol 4-phosphate cytidylyltransferase n=1 Tax=Nocardioides sp. TaxID=35761 RepID=UPI0039E35370